MLGNETKKTERIAAAVSAELRSKVENLCLKLRRPMSQVIELAVEDLIKKETHQLSLKF